MELIYMSEGVISSTFSSEKLKMTQHNFMTLFLALIIIAIPQDSVAHALLKYPEQ